MAKTEKITSIEEIRERLRPLLNPPTPPIEKGGEGGFEGLQLVLLFGSVMSGIVHKQSDIDLAFLFDKPVDILALTNRVIKLLHTDNVDVIDLRRASPLLRFSAVKNGSPIYERSPGVFNEFCSLAFRMYADTKKLRDAQAKAIRYFLEARGLA
jgi:predicted nucleotidyltransferase